MASDRSVLLLFSECASKFYTGTGGRLWETPFSQCSFFAHDNHNPVVAERRSLTDRWADISARALPSSWIICGPSRLACDGRLLGWLQVLAWRRSSRCKCQNFEEQVHSNTFFPNERVGYPLFSSWADALQLPARPVSLLLVVCGDI